MEKPEFPSLPEQGKNLAKFTFEVVKQVMSNNDSMFVSDDTREKRMDVCKQCEYYDSRQNRCRHCGCFLEHKVRFAIDSCPLDKWKETDVDWVKEGFDKVVEDINKPELPAPNRPSFPREAEIGERYMWRNHVWSWNGAMWDYIEEVQEE